MIIPAKLERGDLVRVIAPARSLNILNENIRQTAIKNLESLGLKVSFGKNTNEVDDFYSSSIQSRVEDIHDAFRDREVKGILTAIGGSNANQLLRYLDWQLISDNPKILCGYSDITALSNSIYAKTGIVTYSGMNFSSFGQKSLQTYNTDHFTKCLFSDESYTVTQSKNWSDDEWYTNQDKRNLIPNDGWWIINEGRTQGTILGGNLSTMRLLYGTEYMPKILGDTIFFIEDDNYTTEDVTEFDRNLQSLIHQTDFRNVKAIVIGRFQIGSKMSKELITKIVKTKKELSNMPVIANVDFGHTDPIFTFPVGGEVVVDAYEESSLEFARH